MNIGIICAMDIEKDAFLSLFDHVDTIHKGPLTVYQVGHHQHHIYVVKSGIGKVNAAYVAGYFFEHFNIDACLNTGISGGISVALGDVIIGTETAYFDVDVTAFSYAYGQVPELPPSFKADERLLSKTLTLAAANQCLSGVLTSGDQFVTSLKVLMPIMKAYPNIKAVDMESTAIAHVAHLQGVPFLAFRTISDVIGASDQLNDHDQRVQTAIDKGAFILKELCDVL